MKRQQTGNRRLINLIYLALFVFFISWILLWGGNSFYHRWKLDHKKHLTELKTVALKAQNDSLAQANNRLKTDPAAAEEVAREEYGLINKNETIYHFKSAQADSVKQKK